VIADLRNAAVAALEAAEIPGVTVTNARLESFPKATRLGVNVSVVTDQGDLGPSAGYACDITAVLMLECLAVGRGDTATSNALDALAYGCLRALLVSASFRAEWPVVKWTSELYFAHGAEESSQKRIVKITVVRPVDFTVAPDTALLQVFAGYDVGRAPDADAPAVSDRIEVSG